MCLPLFFKKRTTLEAEKQCFPPMFFLFLFTIYIFICLFFLFIHFTMYACKYMWPHLPYAVRFVFVSTKLLFCTWKRALSGMPLDEHMHFRCSDVLFIIFHVAVYLHNFCPFRLQAVVAIFWAWTFDSLHQSYEKPFVMKYNIYFLSTTSCYSCIVPTPRPTPLKRSGQWMTVRWWESHVVQVCPASPRRRKSSLVWM